ncbi:Arylsulfatase [Pontiella desulfatans]|uniref:Arylsulfatase n=1 Tax=Pontiella desulfatans TaxID=2750659 RepID=A0A6C2U106_PONDE|nr:sulfatase-like hydrolase/transferase [Pontiella desulfatans]SPS73861.1 sulfatase S1_16 [Kiritimatiellales bacterium]VGO13650.1 Arylsulfatase [Pontiella desulfatans]
MEMLSEIKLKSRLAVISTIAVLLSGTSLADVFDITMYGATPDDGTNDTVGIQAALDAADALAGVDEVYLPPGDYWVDTLKIGNDTIFRGDGSSVTRLQANDYRPNGSNILKNKSKQSGNENITIRQVCFDGRRSSQTNDYLHSVNMQNVVGLLVEDCAFENSKNIGCVVQGTQVEDCQTEILNCTSTGNELGFYAQSRDGLIDSLNGIVYSNCVSSADRWGFDVYLASNVLFMACEANSASNGHGSGFTSDSCTDLNYFDCLAEGNEKRGFAVFINNNNLRQPCDITFSNCVSRGNGQNGFEIANAYDVTLTDIQSYENGEYGIVALSSFRYDRLSTGHLIENSTIVSNGLDGIFLRGIQDSEIRSNTITDNGLDPADDASGILIANGTYLVPDMPSTNIIIRNNIIGGAEQDYGVESIGLTDGITLQNNDLDGNLIAPYSLVGSNNTIISSPNIVVIMADDMGWRDLGCFGSTFYETPHIDQLCSEGIAFTDAYASAPLCSASRAAMLTGWAPARQHITGVPPATRSDPEFNYTNWTDPAVMKNSKPYPVTIPQQQEQLPLSSITIAERLKEAGYATGFFGKWHLGPDADKMASQQGFDVAKADHHLGFPKSYFSPYQNPHLTDGPTGEQLTDRLAAEACTFISNNVAASTPFFCYVPTFAVHGPYEAKQAYIDYFTGTRDETNAQNFAIYAGMVKSLDDAVGTIVAELKAQGVYENTIIIFTSDNGGIRMDAPDKTDGNKIVTSMRPLRGAKTSTYEGGLRIPTIVRWPGVAPRESDEVIVTHDIYPTLLDAAGLEQLPGNPLDGINLKPYITDQTPTGRDFVTWFFPHYTLIGQPEWNRSGAVIRKGKWKLRHFWDGTDNPVQPWANELYDLDADIGETTNLADQYPEKVSELEALLLAELTAQNAHVPVPNTTNYDEARWFSYWDEQKAAKEYLWSTQQGTPLMWLSDYELMDGFNWHAADWKDINGVPAWQVYTNGGMPVPFRMDAAGGTMDYRHPVRDGYRYAVMATESLTDPHWQEVSADVSSSNGFKNITLPVGGDMNRFYSIWETLGGQTNVIWSESFGEASLNTNWTAYTQGSGASVIQTGGQLVLDASITNKSAQAALNTTTDQTGTMTTFVGEKLYNFYDHPVIARFDIASISGTNGTGKSEFFFSIGDDAVGKYQPQGNALDDGIGFRLEQAGSPGAWRIVYQALEGASASGGTVANLSGIPSAITYVMDGAQATILLEDSTDTSNGSSEVTVTLEDYSANITGYTLAFGVFNLGNVDTKTVATLDAVSIEVTE